MNVPFSPAPGEHGPLTRVYKFCDFYPPVSPITLSLPSFSSFLNFSVAAAALFFKTNNVLGWEGVSSPFTSYSFCSFPYFSFAQLLFFFHHPLLLEESVKIKRFRPRILKFSFFLMYVQLFLCTGQFLQEMEGSCTELFFFSPCFFFPNPNLLLPIASPFLR